MPRYFFNLENHFSDIDEVGTDLPDDNVAKRQAVAYVGECLRTEPHFEWDGSELKVEVRNAEGTVLLNIHVTARAPGETAAA